LIQIWIETPNKEVKDFSYQEELGMKAREKPE
jgi:hypothetical protein